MWVPLNRRPRPPSRKNEMEIDDLFVLNKMHGPPRLNDERAQDSNGVGLRLIEMRGVSVKSDVGARTMTSGKEGDSAFANGVPWNKKESSSAKNSV